MKIKLLLFLVNVSSLCLAQSEELVLKSIETRKQLESSLLAGYPARNIGPTIQGGRIVDIDVNLNDTKEFYVAYASGGIFKTTNNGITFSPIFDNSGAMIIGDFALSQSDAQWMYVGTGEKNGSRSSYAGSGVYKTTNGGKNWSHLGLTNTQHISRVLIDPKDNNTVWVASLGALYSTNSDRGIYKTSDGGKTWKKTLFINDSTGVSDLMINPKNPKELWAASWERTRKAWNFKGNGVGSAIYKSTDGGETWSKSVSGFPQGKFTGRIGLDICWTQPNIVYAIVDNQEEVKLDKKEKPSDKYKITDFKNMTAEALAKLDDKKLDEFLKENDFPRKYNASLVKKEIKEGKYTPKAIADYYGEDANANLFNTKIKGAEVYRSDDGGVNWKRTHTYDIDGVYFSYGYYFAEMRVSPADPNLLYIYGVPMLKSTDAGKNWVELDTVGNVHSDHHALWINPKDPKHIMLGNDGGLYQSYDEGANWNHINNMPAGQFYSVNVDMETPYNVYGGLQDNGTLKGSSKSIPNKTKHWEMIFGGDGMMVAPDPRNSKLVYTGFQFGNYFRQEIGKNTRITPKHNLGEAAYRWNWRTPMFLSKHNPDIVYMAAQKVFRSFNKGDTFDAISSDLTLNKKQGNVPFSTISALCESPLQFGLLYAGTDDGNVWVSKDAGASWIDISDGLPSKRWVSSVFASPHEKATIFVTVNGYREDDFKTYLFMSTDFGKNWKSINGNLPESVANVIIQDPVNPDLLYCGLDNGSYISLDKGASWSVIKDALNVAAYDMLVHPRDNELVIGTHGRSVFVMDVKPLQALRDGGVWKPIVAFKANPETLNYNEKWGEKQYEWAKANTPSVSIQYYVGKAGIVKADVYDEKNTLVRTLEADGAVGFHFLRWDVKINEVVKEDKSRKQTSSSIATYARKGKYKIKFVNGTESSEVSIEVK